jgi:FKBP-type peptidyl-prolyl cis-trans isomerase FkpA
MRRLLFLLAAVASLTACNLDVPAPTQAGSREPSNPDTETFNPTLQIDLTKMTKTAAGTYFMDYSVGNGLVLSGDRQVLISFLGVLKSGVAFGSADSLSVPMTSLVGGLRDGMVGMKEGGERLIVMPSALGFGPAGALGVPPNSTLIYDIILHRID